MLKKISFATLMWSIAPLALAHGEGAHSHGTGLIAGLAHPFSGLDHLLAMVAVGLWAAQKGGRSLWILPLTFVGMMVLGGALGGLGISLLGIETGIVLSVMVLGLLVALQSRWALPLAGSMVGLFAMFHGMAHGVEMPNAASPWAYGLGMMAATAFLHATGVLAGMKLREITVRVTGAMISVAGLGMVFPLLG
jgi:urease accessory protein